ncbi:hypothetical protein K458DRAFT_323066 [Lentithecium fluviatile CBS 122367]|uniref:Uncharacterized protein n=1 Tax=Lentithecium fluviatile CBS 122367 TaxID=1168545 RepID=A0A6G1ICS4_9PLEO|nr:hypothetical protein K458DRAFT_323066 [Lentithecium fluviatile CBS 122367]
MKTRNYRQVVDAFGKGSPGCNLSFPNGNLTAAEIVAYCPHWLKSVDVIDRFITNGGKSNSIAAMINEFRDQPGGDTIFVPNSVCMMMQCAMRGAGFNKWSVGKHSTWRPAGKSEWDESRLNVGDFRTPRLTHPKGHIEHAKNRVADPIEFRDLALYVKKHPSGFDALDLTPCVLYAIEHPQESWLFPDDFEKLTNKIGGQQQVDWLHCDRQVFFRRDGARNPTTNNGTITPGKRIHPDEDVDSTPTSSVRRSGRLATNPVTNTNLFDDDTDSDNSDKAAGDKTERAATKKRKIDYDIGIDVFQPDNATSSDASLPENISDEDFNPKPVRKGQQTPTHKGRAAAHKAKTTIKTIAGMNKYKQKMPLPTPLPKAPEIPIDPALMEAAANFPKRKPVYLKPPVLSRERLVVDELSVHLYSEEGATNLWASALSSTRFNGPRRHPPFRELHRLTDPNLSDDSDWAENIRWAKEQEKVYGSTTWTEYDYHLECITEHRRKTMWVSEEAIRYGRRDWILL